MEEYAQCLSSHFLFSHVIFPFFLQQSLDSQRKMEVEEYAQYLGMDPVADEHLLWIAEVKHAATHCNTLQHTATHCNTLQHTATHVFTFAVDCRGKISQKSGHYSIQAYTMTLGLTFEKSNICTYMSICIHIFIYAVDRRVQMSEKSAP